MGNHICILIYSHSDCVYVWYLITKLLLKHNIDNIDIIWGIDRNNGFDFPKHFKIYYYDVTKNYTSRVSNILNQINYENIIFLHEDWIPTNDFSLKNINKVIDIMKIHNIEHVRSYKNIGPYKGIYNEECNIYIDKEHKIQYIPNNAPNVISLQPALWKSAFLKKTFELIPNKTIAYTENMNDARKFWIERQGSTYLTCANNSSQNSYFFPHIHAINRSKWCNIPELIALLNEYDIDPHIRGIK